MLRHPCTNNKALFLIAEDGNGTTHLAELNTFDEGNRSWFVGDTVVSDGKLYIATPFNPTYLILPYLMKADRNVPLDHLLDDEQFPGMQRLAALAGCSLSMVADAKGTADLNVWKYNSEKTLTWLEKNTLKLSDKLMSMKVPTTTAQALTFVRTMNQSQTQEAYLQLAHGILSDYLPEELSVSLRKKLNLPDPATLRNKQRASSGPEGQHEPKKARTEGPAEDYTTSSVPVKKVTQSASAKSRALAKSAVGNKSIMSFFSKK